MNTSVRHSLLIAAIATGLPAVAPAQTLLANRGGFSQAPRPSLFNPDSARVRFDVPLASLAADPSASLDSLRPSEGTAIRVYGGLGNVLDVEAARGPARQSAFGLSLQHRLDARDSVAITTEYGEKPAPAGIATQEIFETRTAVSWTRAFDHRMQPALTGSVFLGDEWMRDDVTKQAPGQRYLGFEVSGQLTLFQSHTPYLAFQMRRNYFDGSAAMGGDKSVGLTTRADDLLVGRNEDRSQLTAGWRWQAAPGLSLHAQASYGLNNDSSQSLFNPERSRVFFGTRFDFR